MKNKLDKPDWTNRFAALLCLLVLVTYVLFIIRIWSE